MVGLAWSLAALIALPDAHHETTRAVYLLFVCATSATIVVNTAARRAYFYLTQLALLTPVNARWGAGASDEVGE